MACSSLTFYMMAWTPTMAFLKPFRCRHIIQESAEIALCIFMSHVQTRIYIIVVMSDSAGTFYCNLFYRCKASP